MPRSLTLTIGCLAMSAVLAALAAPLDAANWNVARVGHQTLSLPPGVVVEQMSGVTYVGPVEGGAHRFIAAEEELLVNNRGQLVQFDLTFQPNGAIGGIANITPINIDPSDDFEGIAYTGPERNSVFLSYENGPGIREIALATGAELQSLAVPQLFIDRKRGNLTLESLVRTRDGAALWTGTEQALQPDGPISSQSVGSIVRLLKYNLDGHLAAPAAQYAYQVEPIHGGVVLNTTSGLSDLAAMPDGTLLALERSLASASPQFLNRIFELDFNGATDVSVGPLAAGLSGQTYTKVGKQLLWSGAADNAGGQNLEGLTLGPQLPSGGWVLIGVVDNGDRFFSGNTIVAFLATANPSADFDQNGRVDGADLLIWQRSAGKSAGATLADGDADRDGDVDESDLGVWKAAAPPPPAEARPAAQSLPEPNAAFAVLLTLLARHRHPTRIRHTPFRAGGIG